MANVFHRSPGACALMVLSLTACEAPRDSGNPPASAGEPPPRGPSFDLPPPPPPPDPNVLEAPLDVSDPEHVELLDVVRQATALARRLEPEAELSAVQASRIMGGVLNLRTWDSHLGTIAFHVTNRDPRRPPGLDVKEARVVVSILGGGKLRAQRHETVGDALFKMLGPLPIPACSARRAWDVAVASGMPSDAVASVSIWRLSAGLKPEWSFRVKGHDEHSRFVDASTCALRGAASTPKPGPSAGRPPHPAAKKDCGCAANDLLCQMKCGRPR